MRANFFRPLHALIRPALCLLLLWPGWAPQLEAASTTSGAEPHTFTNDSGASFSGQITSVVGDEVTIKREDGQSFRPKIAAFGKADQKYIHDWVVKNATIHGDGVFSFHAVTVKGVQQVNPEPSKHQATTIWPENYQLTLKNLTSVNWNALQVRYIVFSQNAVFGELPPNDFLVRRTSGSLAVEKFSSNESKTFSLEKISMASYIKTNGYTFSSGAPNAASDKIRGVWVRVYDEDNNLLQEWTSDPDILKTERWTVTPVAHGGVRGGATDPHAPAPQKPATSGK